MTPAEFYEVPFPFIRETVTAGWEHDQPEILTWRPGISWAECERRYGGYDLEAYADGMGHMLLTVVKRVDMPRPYQNRVFYVRQWRDPSGKVFGNKSLRITTAGSFTRMRAGYRHEFDFEPAEVAA
jgi:hypothetical protein